MLCSRQEKVPGLPAVRQWTERVMRPSGPLSIWLRTRYSICARVGFACSAPVAGTAIPRPRVVARAANLSSMDGAGTSFPGLLAYRRNLCHS